MRYNPALDGLRAVAILLVLAYHLNASLIPGGFTGVDVFFVLSGYLITTILLREIRQTGEISLKSFYIRRALRLTPPIALLVIFQTCRLPFSHQPYQIIKATLVSAAYLENWNNVFQFSPFDVLGHTWSLATEEQFYFVWPLLLPLVFKRRPLVWLVIAAVLMTAVRAFLCSTQFAPQFDGAQFLVSARPVGLLIGCALAFPPAVRLPPVFGLAAFAALVALAFSPEATVVALHAQALFVIAPLIASLATATVIILTQQPGALSSALCASPLRYVGKISYGLYLYHWPAFKLGAISTSSPLHTAGLVVLVFVTAAISYEFVEKPFLRMKDRICNPATTAPAIVSIVA
jgi:peptidoglycan/LPS O-acetylase OafA/YrhL